MRAKVRVNAMRDAVALSKDQERMRRRHDVTIKTSPPVYEPSIPAEEKYYSVAEIAKLWGGTLCGEYSLRLQACSRSATRAGMSHFASLHECCKDKPQNFLLAEKKPQNKSLRGVLLCVLFKPRFERFGRFNSHVLSMR